MVAWDAEDPPLILRHRAHNYGKEKIKLIDILQNLPMDKKSALNMNKRNGVIILPCCFPRIP